MRNFNYEYLFTTYKQSGVVCSVANTQMLW